MCNLVTLLLLVLGLTSLSDGVFPSIPGVQQAFDDHDQCFCKLQGGIDDCLCNVDTVDTFNNNQLYPRLNSLLSHDYFKFYKVDLGRECPFWSDDSKCAIRYCHVETCGESDIPPGLKGGAENVSKKNRYTEEAQNFHEGCDTDTELGYLNTTISAAAHAHFLEWEHFDDSNSENFCDESGYLGSNAAYVDLSLNPERYTGYKGDSAHRIWHSIYRENCFRPKATFKAYIESAKLQGMCLEKRSFYRAISGLHSSINIHLSSRYLLSDKSSLGLPSPGGTWGPNLAEFYRRFSPEHTEGEGPNWLQNLYFLYILEMRAIAKASPYLLRESYFTGKSEEDKMVSEAVRDILKVIKGFPHHFNESTMFNGGKQAIKLKNEFRQHFRNISRIMDCVGCEKCKLWGKLQIQGLGTALKILFSGRFDLVLKNMDITKVSRNEFQLHRMEIVALFNAFGRLSTSIFELENFRKLMR
ncbi:ero1-like protein isoform X2 [Neocloeon triangulifer]|uniref:ero1-like protein isoform X2 n=1 Tax=Neocloeon triangulifer TaxID=2078957 RepID=UPI00286EF216|nr:ero1-like protein isoform X2 [Neocloeon triangulifer]